jgi:ferredoxin
MDAIIIDSDHIARVDRKRCIGCGLCVTNCETQALSLLPKTGEEQRDPPKTARDLMTLTAEQRGKSLVPLAFQNAAGKPL